MIWGALWAVVNMAAACFAAWDHKVDLVVLHFVLSSAVIITLAFEAKGRYR